MNSPANKTQSSFREGNRLGWKFLLKGVKVEWRGLCALGREEQCGEGQTPASEGFCIPSGTGVSIFLITPQILEPVAHP